MLDDALTDLTRVYGFPTAAALAAAYESAILSLSLGEWDRIPNMSVRLVLVDAMMAEGRVNGFVPERMTQAALAAIAPRAKI